MPVPPPPYSPGDQVKYTGPVQHSFGYYDNPGVIQSPSGWPLAILWNDGFALSIVPQDDPMLDNIAPYP